MKKIFTLFAVILLSSFFSANLYAQSFNWLWAKSIGTTPPAKITVDGLGNVFVANGFWDNVEFDTDTLTNAGGQVSNDIYIAKYNASGVFQWALSFGNSSSDEIVSSISTDSVGNVYLVGGFYTSTMTFGSITINNHSFNNETFIVKISGAGVVLWAKAVGGSGSDGAGDIITDANGNSYVGGTFESSVTIGNTTLASSGNADAFIYKINTQGNFVWAKKAGGSGTDRCESIALDPSKKFFAVAGTYNSPSITLGTISLTNTHGNYDFFIARYDSSGNSAWAQTCGSNDEEVFPRVKIDHAGDICFVGEFPGSSITAGSNTFTNLYPGSTDLLIAKYDIAGNVLWAKNASGNDNDNIADLAIDPSNNIYLTGYYYSTPITFHKQASGGSPNQYLAKYNSSGTLQWYDQIFKAVYDIFIDNAGHMYLAGYYQDSIKFGNITLHGTGLSGFVVKTDNVVGIEEVNASASNLIVYPNPASGEFFVFADGNGEKSLEIFNALGELIFSEEKLRENPVRINCKFNSGIYYIRIAGDQKMYSGKVVVE